MFDQTLDCRCEHCCLPTIVEERDEAMSRLARACELLRDAMWNLREADRAHLAEPISAFLAGEGGV